MRQAVFRSSDRTATGSSTPSIVSRCGRTSMACTLCRRGVAIVSQSGNVAVNLTFQQRGLRLGMIMSVGNQASVGTEDCIEAFLDDQRITAIGLFLEAVRDAQQFAAVAARAHAQGVPIVALQTGRSAAGAAIATSHTGSMSGPRRGLRRAVRAIRNCHGDDARRDVGDAQVARQRRSVERPANRLDELLGRRGLAGGRSRRGRSVAFRTVRSRTPTSDRVDSQRAGHRQ